MVPVPEAVLPVQISSALDALVKGLIVPEQPALLPEEGGVFWKVAAVYVVVLECLRPEPPEEASVPVVVNQGLTPDLALPHT